ncbi:hypothetical protein QQ045_005699 [Rhodiola kirilowii]
MQPIELPERGPNTRGSFGGSFGGFLYSPAFIRTTDPLPKTMKFTPPDLLDLFARLASTSTTTSSSSSAIDDAAVNDTISKLNTCLNVEGQETDSRVRVLDAALSLLCFKAPQVYDSAAEFTVNTIIQLLSSSVACRAIATKKEEVLVVGSLLSNFDCLQVVEACNGVIGALEKRGMVSEMRKIVYGVTRLVVSTPCCWTMLPSNVVALDIRPAVSGKSNALTKLHRYFPKDLQDTNDLPVRLLWWYLDPLLLKNDVLKILEEALRRPFLCLNKALRERVDWRSTIACLAITPMMFIEIRGLLHRWFLETGLDIVQELLSELISGILDITSSPICWGLKAETGMKLPFSITYFPWNPSLLRILIGPISSKGIENIVRVIHKHVGQDTQPLGPQLERVGIHSARIDDQSSWALAMNFPEWFYYSCVLLFSGDIFEDNDSSVCAPRAIESNQMSIDKAPKLFAAQYISWILSPINLSHQLAMCEFFSSMTKSGTLNQDGTNLIHKDAPGCQKKQKKAKHVDEKDIASSSILSSLNRFQRFFSKLSNETLGCPKPNDHHKNLLYRRVPLGILIGNHNDVTDKECELLMHYAIAGTILSQKETPNVGQTHRKQNAEYTKDVAYDIGRDEAIAGIHLAFRLGELAEKVCDSLFGTEQSAVKCACQIKIRLGKYLLKCIKILLENNFDDGSSSQIMDIRSRLNHWRQQGPDLPSNCEELDNVLSKLDCSLTFL